MKRSILFTISILLIISCSDKKQDIITTFDRLNLHIIQGNSTEIDNQLTSESKVFLDDLTSLTDISQSSIIRVGEKYKIKDFLFGYLLKYKPELESNNTSASFYQYLGLSQIPLFDFQNIWIANKEMTKVNPDIYVAIYKQEYGNKYLNWVRFIEEDGQLKYDLLYALELANKKKKEFYDRAFQNSKLKDPDEFYAKLIDFSEPIQFSKETFEHSKDRRLALLKESKSQ